MAKMDARKKFFQKIIAAGENGLKTRKYEYWAAEYNVPCYGAPGLYQIFRKKIGSENAGGDFVAKIFKDQ